VGKRARLTSVVFNGATRLQDNLMKFVKLFHAPLIAGAIALSGPAFAEPFSPEKEKKRVNEIVEKWGEAIVEGINGTKVEKGPKDKAIKTPTDLKSAQANIDKRTKDALKDLQKVHCDPGDKRDPKDKKNKTEETTFVPGYSDWRIHHELNDVLKLKGTDLSYEASCKGDGTLRVYFVFKL
jgi:hypothetical protein